MTITSKTVSPPKRFHQDAYQFLFAGLHHAQRRLNRSHDPDQDESEEGSHISGYELLDGVRDLAQRQFGLLTQTVFRHWGIRSTADFGRMVFELIDRGEMKRTDRDQMSDFVDVYEFDEEFDRKYRINTSHAFGD